MSGKDRVSSGDYSAKGLFKRSVVRKKLGTLLPFYWPLPSSLSTRLLQFAGVCFTNRKKVFIGVGVWIDSAFPEKVQIGEHVIIGAGVKVLTHSGPTALQTGRSGLTTGNVKIGDGVMVGVGAILLPNVRIGDEATVAAGSVVTKDVPQGTVVAGNPAKIVQDKPDVRGTQC